MAVTRRTFVWTLVSSALSACAAGSDKDEASVTEPPFTNEDAGASSPSSGGTTGGGQTGATSEPDAGDIIKELPPVAPQPKFTFDHGVASGDPLKDRVILWTRITPEDVDAVGDRELVVDFVVATDTQLKNVIGRGRARTSSDRDFTVKVDVDGLSAGTTYYYQFFDAADVKNTSSTGRTKTLPTGALDRARFGVVSCSCYALGYFNAYAFIAGQRDLDAVLHLGDYIYEYGPDVYNEPDVGRPHDPAHEIVTLEDYRRRHAQYKTDPDLQEAHRQHPFITIWDDHEIANDAYKAGAENHTEGAEGAYEDRKTAGYRAYHEWMPIRELDPNDKSLIYRSFAYGDLLDLIMLESRARRDKQDRNAAASTSRSLLGETEAVWLEDQLSSSLMRGTTWRVLGQQVMIGQLKLFGQVLNADQWDGYEASRLRLFDYLEREGIDNVVVLTGDIHSSWAMEVAKDPYGASYDKNTSKGALAVEFVATSVTSPALDFLSGAAANLVLGANPHMRWANLEKRGCVLLDVTHERVQADWFFVSTIKMPSASLDFAKGFQTLSGKAQLVEVMRPAAPKTIAPAFAD